MKKILISLFVSIVFCSSGFALEEGPGPINPNSGLIPTGTTDGDILYWEADETQPPVCTQNPQSGEVICKQPGKWELLEAPAADTNMLSFCDGKLAWKNKGCRGYKIGDTGPAGGIVFWVDVNDPNHGLEAAPVDQSNGVAWSGCTDESYPGVDGTARGTGRYNTEAIIFEELERTQGTSEAIVAGNTIFRMTYKPQGGTLNQADILLGKPSEKKKLCGISNFAAKVAAEYELNGYRDWYLPSQDELDLMHENLVKDRSEPLGDFAARWYWSSSEHDSGGSRVYVWSQDFAIGNQYGVGKDTILRVRAIRAF